MVNVNFDIDFDDFMDDADDFEVEKWVKEYIQASDPEWLSEVVGGASVQNLEPVAYLLEDPVKRLEVIVGLRKLGYTVESA